MNEPEQPARLRVAFAIAAIFAARFGVAAWFDPRRDADLAWQQWLGMQILRTGHLPHALGPETFAANGAPWVPQEWALSILVALTLGKPSFILLAALAALSGCTVMLFTGLAAKKLGASSVCAAIAVACVGISMLESFGIRAQVFGWALLAAMMYLLRCVPGRRKWWIVPLVALWANLHASAMLAPVLVLLWAVGTALQEGAWNARVREYFLLAAACAAAILMTPLGFSLPLYTLHLLHSPIRSIIDEWQPASLTRASFTFGVLPLLLATCAVGFERSRRWPEMLVFAATAWLALTAVRNIPVCAVVIAPACAARLSAAIPERARINAMFGERSVAALLLAGALFAACASGVALARTPQFRAGTLPSDAIARLASIPGTHLLYCENFAWCSLALQHRNIRPFIDGRCDPFPIAVWKDQLVIQNARDRWHAVADRRGINAMLAHRGRALARGLASWPGWHLVYADEDYRLFSRDPDTADQQH